MVKQIKKEELRKMHDREGLVLQGCGGDLKEWVDGINQMLEQEGILPKGKRLDEVAAFKNEGMTNLLFFFGEERLDIEKLAVWRLKTRYHFGSTWMSDYVNNRLGGFLREAVAEYTKAFGRMLDVIHECGGKTKWRTAEEVFSWWMEDFQVEGQMSLTDFEEWRSGNEE